VAVLKPVATAYRDVVPELVRTGVTNVLGNIGDVWSQPLPKVHMWTWACAW
jgi:ABC-type transporter lipoprotein component MlaA